MTAVKDAAIGDASPVHLLKGSDPVLLATLVSETVDRLVGTDDRAMVVDEYSGDDYALGEPIIASTTVSMFGRRIVVVRSLGRFSTDELAPVLQYLAAPSPDTILVLVWEKAVAPGARLERIPKKLTDAVKTAGGETHDASIPGGKGRSMWVEDQLSASSVRLSNSAKNALVTRLGEDLNRLGGVLSVLEASFGDVELSADDIEPYLGDAGGVPPWELTDAIDSGQVSLALDKLQRMLMGGDRHSLQVMVTIRSHFERMLRLDGSGVRDEKAAAALLGMKGSTFPAKKAMAQSQKLGPDKLRRAVVLLAAADADLRGRTGQSPEAVLQTLVARLAAMSSRSRSARR
ncbi:MAG: DNA polymerase III subunit delta [Microthrixaceae bacterium]